VALATKLYLDDTDEEANRRTEATLGAAEAVANVIARFGVRTVRQAHKKYLIGSPDNIARKIQPYVDAGVTLVIMNCLAPEVKAFVRMLTRFTEEVVPLVTSHGQSAQHTTASHAECVEG